MWIRHPCLSEALQRFLVELLLCFRLMNYHASVQNWSEEASCSTVTQSKKSQREPLLVDDWFLWNPLWGLCCLLEGLLKTNLNYNLNKFLESVCNRTILRVSFHKTLLSKKNNVDGRNPSLVKNCVLSHYLQRLYIPGGDRPISSPLNW